MTVCENRNLYEDRNLSIDQDGLTVHNVYRPGQRTRIPFDAIRDATLVPLGFFTGRHQLIGLGPFRPRLWFQWDRARSTKRQGISIDRGSWLRLGITPDDPDRVLEILSARSAR